jgi:multiple sugar transport system permease protein
MSGDQSGKGILSFVPLFGPFLLLWFIFWLVPLFTGLELSFTGHVTEMGSDGTMVSEYKATWGNYQAALGDSKWVKSLENTTLFVVGSITSILTLSFFLASVIFRMHRVSQAICLFLLIVPSLALPGTLAKLFYLFFHGKSGVLNQFLVMPLGFQQVNWMMNPDWILPCLVFQSVWRWTGLITLLLFCGMQAIPRWQFETASLEGANRGMVLQTILFPGVKHLLWFAAIFLLVDGVAAFSGAYNLLGGSGGVLDAGLLFVTYVYQVAFPGGSGRFDLPLASAMSLAVAIATTGIAYFLIWSSSIKGVAK